jgi:hypothetical protein
VKVRSGWSTDYGHEKYDVELDETDLSRILITGGIPLEAQARLSPTEAHTLLYCSAEIIARMALARFDPKQRDKLKAEVAALREELQRTLGTVREKSSG